MTYLTTKGAAVILAAVFGFIGLNAETSDAMDFNAVKYDIYKKRFGDFNNVNTPVIAPKKKTVQYDMQDRLCLYMTVSGEASNQSDEGQRALASNILNRVEDSRFPSTICKVAKQTKIRRGKTVYQYDAWNPKGPNLARMKDDFSDDNMAKMIYKYKKIGSVKKCKDLKYDSALRVMCNSMLVMRGNRNLPKDSFNFHPVGYKAGWVKGLKKYAEIDDHVFYEGF